LRKTLGKVTPVKGIRAYLPEMIQEKGTSVMVYLHVWRIYDALVQIMRDLET